MILGEGGCDVWVAPGRLATGATVATVSGGKT